MKGKNVIIVTAFFIVNDLCFCGLANSQVEFNFGSSSNSPRGVFTNSSGSNEVYRYRSEPASRRTYSAGF